jgi:flagellar assembly protein FliH
MSSLPDLVSFELAGTGAIPDRLLSQSRSAAAAVGYAHGWSQGLREARESLLAERLAAREAQRRFSADRRAALHDALTSLTSAASQLEAAAAPTSSHIEDAIIAAAVEIAEALIGRELADRDEATRDSIARALRLAPAGEPVTVRINSEIHADLNDADITDLIFSIADAAGRDITFEADPTLAVGDAIAQSGATTIDARLSAGIRRVKEHLVVR